MFSPSGLLKSIRKYHHFTISSDDDYDDDDDDDDDSVHLLGAVYHTL